MRRRSLIVATALTLCAMGVASTASASTASADPGEVVYRTKVHVRGAQIHGANGVAIDAQGHLLVGSVFGAEIVVVDTRTGSVVDHIGLADGVDSPDDVAVGPDGSIYWTDIGLGEVGRLTPDGVLSKQFVAPGMNPIAFTADGRLFVASAFFGDGLYELDPNLQDPPRVVIPDSGGATPERQLNGFDFGPDGMLYAPQPFLNRIVKIDPETGDLEVVAEGIPTPVSVEFDSKGRLYTNARDGRVGLILRWDFDPDARDGSGFGRAEIFASIPETDFDNMVFDSRDRLYVSDANNGAVFKVTPGGGVRTLVPGGLTLPSGVAVMDGSLYVADVWRLVEHDERSGRELGYDRNPLTATLAGAGIIAPFTVSAAGDHLILSSWVTNAVQVWDPAARTSVELYDGFFFPLNAIAFQGDVVAVDLTGNVTRIDQAGNRSVVAGGLFVPSGLAATDDDLWVADWASGLIWQLVADGTTLAAPQIVTGGLFLPEGMAVDRDGSLLVVESGAGRLVRVDPATGATSTVADGLATGVVAGPGLIPTLGFSSVALGERGSISVTGDAGSVVYRLSPTPAR